MTMELFSLWMTMLGSLLLVLQRCCYAKDCVFQYTQEPPSFLTCNPYSNSSSISQLQVTLVCGAQRNDNKKDEWTFDLRWFSNYSITSLDHEVDVVTPSFINATLLVSSSGQYWCQVLDYTDGGHGHLLERTNVVEVLSWNQYTNFSMCIGYQSVMGSKCADLSPTPNLSPTSFATLETAMKVKETIVMDAISPSTLTGSAATDSTTSCVQVMNMQLSSNHIMCASQTDCAASETNIQPFIISLTVMATVSFTINFLMVVIVIVLIKKLSDTKRSLKCHNCESTSTAGTYTQDDNHLQQTGPMYDIPQLLTETHSEMELKENVCYGGSSIKITDNVANIHVSKC